MALAIKPADNEAFYREVDEELRREQLTSFWTRYGTIVVVGVILLLAAIAGVIYWQHRQDVKAGEKGEALTAAFADIQAGRTDGIAARMDEIAADAGPRSEEHTSELQSLMRISYAVFCLKKKKKETQN